MRYRTRHDVVCAIYAKIRESTGRVDYSLSSGREQPFGKPEVNVVRNFFRHGVGGAEGSRDDVRHGAKAGGHARFRGVVCPFGVDVHRDDSPGGANEASGKGSTRSDGALR